MSIGLANRGRSAVSLSSFGGEGQGEEAVVLKLMLLKFILFHTVGSIRPVQAGLAAVAPERRFGAPRRRKASAPPPVAAPPVCAFAPLR
jgi:hypothetical protein